MASPAPYGAEGDLVPDVIVRAHARRWGHTYGPAEWEAVSGYGRIVADPDFAKLSPEAQDRCLRQLVGSGAAEWWSRRHDRVATRVLRPHPDAWRSREGR